MSETRCTCTKPNGDPCAARALPNSASCVSRDPAHAEACAARRSPRGSTPRCRDQYQRPPRRGGGNLTPFAGRTANSPAE